MTQVNLSAITRTDRQIAILLSGVAFALYVRTLARDVLPGDPGEFHFAAWTLGLAHPTGYPFYLLLGWLWQHTLGLVGLAPALALNALSALAAAVGVGLTYLVSARWLPGDDSRRRVAATYAAALLAVNFTYWSQALIAEVYALHVVFMLLLLWQAQSLAASPRAGTLLRLAALGGLALTHHALTLFWLPALGVYLLVARPDWRRLPGWSWAAALGAAALPLALYVYIPLRSGPAASPWLHQRLGDGMLTLYAGGWPAFWRYLSGQSISVGFRDLTGMAEQLPQATWLWQFHFSWLGLALLLAGVIWLARSGRLALLLATVAYILVQQIFNLAYNIGDILVYYIPLYVVGALWAGMGLAALISGDWRRPDAAPPLTLSPDAARAWGMIGVLVGVLLIGVTARSAPTTAAQLDQSTSTTARALWESILAAPPPADAILVSNDRDEMVPLFYLQQVEGRGAGLTGLFPLIAPDARFTDLVATLDTALAVGTQPVYLIKPMPGLEIRYALAPAAPPLIAVVGPVAWPAPTVAVDQPYGPLWLRGYDLLPSADGHALTLYWEVRAPLTADYTATAQLLTAADTKLAQDDHAPGGVYYPTSTWRVGDRLVVRHTLAAPTPLPADSALLIGFYTPNDFAPLADPLRLPLATE